MELSSLHPSTAGTPWEQGRLDNRQGPWRLLFGRMFEDSSIERSVFPAGGRIFCIASAGCTAFALHRSHEVVAVDINPRQIEYVRRRLEHGESSLGVVDRGLAVLRRFAPLVGWSSARLEAFLELDDPQIQRAYWRRLETKRWQMASDFLLSLPRLRACYSPELLRALPPRFGAALRARLRRAISLHPNRHNPYARALFRGEWPPLKNSADRAPMAPIDLECADAADFLSRQRPGSFDGFALSNIMDGTDLNYRCRLWAAIERAASTDAIAVWRSFSEPSEGLSGNLAATDRSMIWGVVQARPARELEAFVEAPGAPPGSAT